jgi:hypothetical protein
MPGPRPRSGTQPFGAVHAWPDNWPPVAVAPLRNVIGPEFRADLEAALPAISPTRLSALRGRFVFQGVVAENSHRTPVVAVYDEDPASFQAANKESEAVQGSRLSGVEALRCADRHSHH